MRRVVFSPGRPASRATADRGIDGFRCADPRIDVATATASLLRHVPGETAPGRARHFFGGVPPAGALTRSKR